MDITSNLLLQSTLPHNRFVDIQPDSVLYTEVTPTITLTQDKYDLYYQNNFEYTAIIVHVKGISKLTKMNLTILDSSNAVIYNTTIDNTFGNDSIIHKAYIPIKNHMYKIYGTLNGKYISYPIILSPLKLHNYYIGVHQVQNQKLNEDTLQLIWLDYRNMHDNQRFQTHTTSHEYVEITPALGKFVDNYVIFQFKSYAGYEPTLSYPRDLNNVQPGDKLIYDLMGSWECIGVTNNNHFAIHLTPGEMVGFWIGAKLNLNKNIIYHTNNTTSTP